MNNFIKIKCLAILGMLFSVTLPLSVQAEHVQLADQPLVNMGSSDVLPNLMFIMDNSGSMAWGYTPDWANITNVTLFRNSAFNTQFYSPDISYTPAVTHTGASMGNQGSPWTGVSNDVTDTGATKGGTTNLVGNANFYSFLPGEHCTRPDLGNCIVSTEPTATHPFPAPMRWCNSAAAAIAPSVTPQPPTANSCQSVRVGDYTHLRRPSATTIINVGSSNSTRVTAITVNGKQILSAQTSNTDNNTTIATEITANINACTNGITGNCTAAGYSATRAGTQVTIISFWGRTDISTTPTPITPIIAQTGAKTFAPSAFSVRTPGGMTFTNIVATNNIYTEPGRAVKAADRSDCAGTVCTYAEEMTNYANWHTYYRTRMQAMKTATSLAFRDIDSRYRVGFITISSITPTSNYLRIDRFTQGAGGHKQNWYRVLYATVPTGATPLRSALSRVGRIYGGLNPVNVPGNRSLWDPVEYACQQNFALLTTDGYWNSDTVANSVPDMSGNAIGNLDGPGTLRPLFEGPTLTSRTLSDVSKYYFDTDIRASAFNNCIGALGNDVCGTVNDHGKQSMTTMTLGLGIDGTLVFEDNYKEQLIGSFADLRNGAANWPVPVADQPSAVDDLWHAAVNAGGTYYSARNPRVLRESLVKGLSEINSIFGAGTAAASSSLAPVAGDNFQYVASYRTAKWTGNLEARVVDVNTLATSQGASWCVENVAAQSCTPPAVLEANPNGGFYCRTASSNVDSCEGSGGVLGVGGIVDSCYITVPSACIGRLQQQVANNTRNIFVNQANSLVQFSPTTIGSANLSAFVNGYNNLSQFIDFTPVQQGYSNADKVTRLVDYLRGNRLYENRGSNPTPENRLFRDREATLGDITESRPAFFKKSMLEYTDSGYENFKALGDARQATVFVGANDGMLHAFNANSGDEMWAFIPTPAIRNMPNIADRNYAIRHRNFVNGSPLVTDVCAANCNNSGASWRSILVGGLNGGGRGYYALNVTNPASPTLLWEFSSANDSDMGYSFGNPLVTKMGPSAGALAGRWVVLLTSGYNNGTKDNDGLTDNSPPGSGRGFLFVLDANTGAVLRKIGTGVGTSLSPSGLGRIAGYATNPFRNNLATHIYGGDLEGNLWRFDINLGTSQRLARLISSNGTSQPITTAPELGTFNNKRIVLVGTGKYLEASDITDTPVNSVYAIKDDDLATTINPRGLLVQQVLNSDGDTRSISASAVNLSTGLGWMVDLPLGERVNLDPLLINGVLLMPSMMPTSTSCAGGGIGWFNYFNFRSGGSMIPGTNLVSEKMLTPAVGFNLMYKDGKPTVTAVGSNDPTPRFIQQRNVAGRSGDSNRTTVLQHNNDNTYGRRSIWRELFR